MPLPETIGDLDEMSQAYARDGVVCLRQAFSEDSISKLRAASELVVADPDAHGNRGYMQGPMTAINFLYRRPSPFRDFVLESPAGEIFARVVGSQTIRMYHDYVFSKQPGCQKVVPWHVDGGGYALHGNMMPNMWIALTPATSKNGRMEFVSGFFREILEGRWKEERNEAGVPKFPDFEKLQSDPEYPFRWVSWDLEPGDAVIFHPYTPHHSKPNNSASTRTGYALRVIGDDVIWDKSKSLWLEMPGVDYEKVQDGAPVDDDDAFPIMWRNSDLGVPLTQ